MTNSSIRASPLLNDYCKLSIITGCLLMIANCNLFKNTATDLQRSHKLSTAITQVKSAEQKDWLSRSGSVYFNQDSSNINYAIQIWPKGTFSFSAGKGFSGEADKVLVTGNVKTGSKSVDQRSSTLRDKGKITQSRNEENKKVFDQKLKTKNSSPSWKWVIVALVILSLAGWFACTKLNPIFQKLR